MLDGKTAHQEMDSSSGTGKIVELTADPKTGMESLNTRCGDY